MGGAQRQKQFTYTATNGASRLTRVTTPMGKVTRYDYTFRGDPAWRQDGKNNVTRFQYDPLERLTAVTDNNNLPLVSMNYDVLDNVTRAASTNSGFDCLYDSLNRVTNAVCLLTNIPGFATVKYKIDYAFDPVGNVTNRVLTGLLGMSGTITTRYQYDVMNRLTNVVQLTNGAIAATAGYQYDSAGRLWKKTYGNNDVVTHSYDMESRLLGLGITNGATLITSYTYGWDAGGSLLAITNAIASGAATVSRYGYDAVGQLTNAVAGTNGVAGGATNTWQYDEAGNWLAGDGKYRLYNADNEFLGTSGNNTNAVTVTGQVTAGPNSNKWYHTTAACRGVTALVGTNTGTFSLPGVPIYPGTNTLVVSVTDVSGNTTQQVRHVIKNTLETFLYDGNGNLTNWSSGTTNWVYEWDWADRLTKVSSNSVVVLQNWYDAAGRRVAKQEVVNGQTNKWLYLYDGWDIVGVMNETGQLLETYTRGVGLAGDVGTLVAVTHHTGSAVTPGTYYVHGNQRGDVMLTRSSSTTTGTYSYSAFGNLQSTTGTDVCRFKFSSKEREVSCGFSYYGIRFYAPQWQRFLNNDPIGEESGINLYGYVYNNPVNNIDVDGRFVVETAAVATTVGTASSGGAGVTLTVGGGAAAVGTAGTAVIGGVVVAGAAAAGLVVYDAYQLNQINQLNQQNQQDAQQLAQKTQEYYAYKNRCRESPPPGLDPCAEARWKLQRNKDCKQLREGFANKWFGGGYDPGHSNYMQDLDRAIKNLEDWIKQNCKPCP